MRFYDKSTNLSKVTGNSRISKVPAESKATGLLHRMSRFANSFHRASPKAERASSMGGGSQDGPSTLNRRRQSFAAESNASMYGNRGRAQRSLGQIPSGQNTGYPSQAYVLVPKPPTMSRVPNAQAQSNFQQTFAERARRLQTNFDDRYIRCATFGTAYQPSQSAYMVDPSRGHQSVNDPLLENAQMRLQAHMQACATSYAHAAWQSQQLSALQSSIIQGPAYGTVQSQAPSILVRVLLMPAPSFAASPAAPSGNAHTDERTAVSADTMVEAESSDSESSEESVAETTRGRRRKVIYAQEPVVDKRTRQTSQSRTANWAQDQATTGLTSPPDMSKAQLYGIPQSMATGGERPLLPYQQSERSAVLQ